jgi:hypothetical protein
VRFSRRLYLVFFPNPLHKQTKIMAAHGNDDDDDDEPQ